MSIHWLVLYQWNGVYFPYTVCCPNGTYGENCDTCKGGATRPCSGNGKCDVSTWTYGQVHLIKQLSETL